MLGPSYEASDGNPVIFYGATQARNDFRGKGVGFGSRDNFGGHVKTLSKNKDRAFELMRLALNEPRFDDEPVQRMKNANIARIKRSLSNPEWKAARIQNDKAFAGHPYRLNSGGTITIIIKIMANGTANSNVSHFIPPFNFKPTKAGAEIKLIADNCVAIVERLKGNHPRLFPPKK